MKKGYTPYLLLYILLLLSPPTLLAQQVVLENLPFYQRDQPEGVHKNAIQFSVTDLPELTRASEEQPAGFTYYWNFGDGHFSLKSSPFHVFQKAGTYRVVVELTPTYTDDFDDDVRITDTIIVLDPGDITSRLPNPVEKIAGAIAVENNRCPVENDSVTFILTYQNTCATAVEGSLIFRFRDGDFIFSRDERYHGETAASETSVIAGADTLVELSWDFSGLGPGELRNLFIVMKTDSPIQEIDLFNEIVFTPIGGCTGIVTVDSPLVACVSHDPNRKSFDTDSISFSVSPGCPGVGDSVTYRIDFQNYGTAPAARITILDTLDIRLDATTVSPAPGPGCIGCETGKARPYIVTVDSTTNSIKWMIDMANLRGLNEPGFDTTAFTVESTKDYIDFRVKLNDAPSECKPGILINRGHIIFDNNEPITTPPAIIVAGCNGCFMLAEDTVELFEMDTLFATQGVPLTLTPDSLPFPLDSLSLYWFPFQDTGMTFTFSPKFTTTVTVQASKKCGPDGNGFFALDTIVVFVPPCLLPGPPLVQVNQISCNGQGDGGIFIQQIGPLDTSQFHVVWDDFSNENPREGLGAGQYIYTLISEACCTFTDTITINQPPPLWPDFDIEMDTLFGLPGGGTPPYSYSWSSGGTDDFIIRNPAVPSYSLMVTDQRGCTASATFETMAIPTLSEWGLILLSLLFLLTGFYYIRRGNIS